MDRSVFFTVLSEGWRQISPLKSNQFPGCDGIDIKAAMSFPKKSILLLVVRFNSMYLTLPLLQQPIAHKR